jgi:hypothetical protein
MGLLLDKLQGELYLVPYNSQAKETREHSFWFSEDDKAELGPNVQGYSSVEQPELFNTSCPVALQLAFDSTTALRPPSRLSTNSQTTFLALSLTRQLTRYQLGSYGGSR